MATLSLTQRYAQMDDWSGWLFQSDDSTSVLTRTSTSCVWQHGDDSEFAGFRVEMVGTGLKYLNGLLVGGRLSEIRVLNDTGALVLTISGLAGSAIGGDAAQIAADMFGSQPGAVGPGPDGRVAWDHVLSCNDVINGTSGNDRREQPGLDAGNDRYNMYAGDDYVRGGIGNDSIYGGAGFDTLSYGATAYNEGASAYRGVTVNVGTRTILDPWGGTDRFAGVEEFEGSRFNDTFNGASGLDSFSGLRGNDLFRGGGGAGDNLDLIYYQSDYWYGGRFGIIVDLQTGTVNGQIRGTIRDGFGNTDTTFDIERVMGTRFDDSFAGSVGDNAFWGGEGRDSYDGDAGVDSVRFGSNFADRSVGDVVVNLSLFTGQVINDGFGNRETLRSIEDVEGGGGNDSLRGNAQDNGLHGYFGRDTLTGGGGNDYFGFWSQDLGGQGDRITDFRATGAAEQDRLGFDVGEWDGMTTTLRLVNGSGPTIAQGQFFFRASNDTLFWDPDGTGSRAAIAVVQLVGVDSMVAANFDLF